MKVKRRVDGILTKEYRAWKAMKARCYSECNKNIGNYQKNNIQVCDRWINSFENFIEDMKLCPFNDYSLDRKDPMGDYCPDNCRWASDKTQSSNRGKFNKVFAHENKEMILKDWAILLNIKYTTLYQRIYRSGLLFEEAIQKDPYKKLITYKGKSKRLFEWTKELNLPYQTMVDRLNAGWEIGRAFEQKIKDYERCNQ